MGLFNRDSDFTIPLLCLEQLMYSIDNDFAKGKGLCVNKTKLLFEDYPYEIHLFNNWNELLIVEIHADAGSPKFIIRATLYENGRYEYSKGKELYRDEERGEFIKSFKIFNIFMCTFMFALSGKSDIFRNHRGM